MPYPSISCVYFDPPWIVPALFIRSWWSLLDAMGEIMTDPVRPTCELIVPGSNELEGQCMTIDRTSVGVLLDKPFGTEASAPRDVLRPILWSSEGVSASLFDTKPRLCRLACTEMSSPFSSLSTGAVPGKPVRFLHATYILAALRCLMSCICQ